MQIDDFPNPELVTIAVAFLDGDVEPVDPEDIAIRVNDIVPERFSWRKDPGRIDLGAVRDALRDAKKPKKGELLVGSNAGGWMLSPAGLKWIKTLDLDAIQDAQSIKHRKDSIAANQEAECARLRGTKAYNLFIDGKSETIALQDFYQFARVNEYFQTKARQRRYAIIDNAVVDDDETLSKLWDLLKERFIEEVT
ncbi:MAG: hypothetical protein IMY80_03185 [Chloroflexi bacterium]|nr:hypothetical protein [Chloroflexota bacterium]